MPDPFLLAHAVAPLSFDIGGRLTPISIRDQMLRGRMIVERGVEAGLIGPGRRLVVVGAGAAGASAAIRAAQRGIETVLIDSAPAPFQRQAGCSTRWVDPTQYDWPVQHWARGHYPWTLPRMPLPWREDYADNLAAAWTQQLNIERRRYSHFGARFNTTLGRPPTIVGTMLRVTFSTPGLPSDYGMLVSGTGFGTENCTVENSPGGTGSGRYAGFRFWDTDDFARPNLNIPSSAQAEVLISGGGGRCTPGFLAYHDAGTVSQADISATLSPCNNRTSPSVDRTGANHSECGRPGTTRLHLGRETPRPCCTSSFTSCPSAGDRAASQPFQHTKPSMERGEVSRQRPPTWYHSGASLYALFPVLWPQSISGAVVRRISGAHVSWQQSVAAQHKRAVRGLSPFASL